MAQTAPTGMFYPLFFSPLSQHSIVAIVCCSWLYHPSYAPGSQMLRRDVATLWCRHYFWIVRPGSGPLLQLVSSEWGANLSGGRTSLPYWLVYYSGEPYVGEGVLSRSSTTSSHDVVCWGWCRPTVDWLRGVRAIGTLCEQVDSSGTINEGFSCQVPGFCGEGEPGRRKRGETRPQEFVDQTLRGACMCTRVWVCQLGGICKWRNNRNCGTWFSYRWASSIFGLSLCLLS